MKTKMDAAAGPGRSADFTDPGTSPNLLEDLPAIPAQRVSEELSTRDLANLAMVSKATNTREGKFAPLVQNCVRKLKTMCIENLCTHIHYATAIQRESNEVKQRMRLNDLPVTNEEIAEGLFWNEALRLRVDPAPEGVRKLDKRWSKTRRAQSKNMDMLERMCFMSLTRRKQSQRQSLLRDYFNAFNYFPTNNILGSFGILGSADYKAAPLDNAPETYFRGGFPHTSFDKFRERCRDQNEHLDNALRRITNDDVRPLFANLMCAFVLAKHPNGPRFYHSYLVQEIEPSFKNLMVTFGNAGASRDGIKAVYRETRAFMKKKYAEANATAWVEFDSPLRPFWDVDLMGWFADERLDDPYLQPYIETWE